MALVLLYPLGAITYESLFRVEPTLRPDWVFTGLGNYWRILHDADVWDSAGHTVLWTVGSVALQLLIGLTAALLLRETFRGRGPLRSVLLVPWATPAVVGALAWKWMYHGQYGLINTILRTIGFKDAAIAWLGNPHTALPAVVVTNVWRGFPFVMVVLLASLLAIPPDLYEAAAVDGASWAQCLRYITVPLLRPSILLTTLLAGIWTFNNFSYIYILTGGGPAGKTDILVTFVYSNGFQYFHFGYAAALSVALFLLVLGASTVYIRLMNRGTPAQ
jgi:multiple sugar transport system permease protein